MITMLIYNPNKKIIFCINGSRQKGVDILYSVLFQIWMSKSCDKKWNARRNVLRGTQMVILFRARFYGESFDRRRP